MESVTQFWNKFLIAFLILLIASCGEKGALKEETILFNEENKDWIITGNLGDNFLMIDSHGIAQSFMMNRNLHEFSTSAGSILFITTKITYREYHYQAFTSNYGNRFSLSLTAGYEPFGDELFIDLNNIGFSWDPKFNTVSRIDTPYGYRSKLMTDEGYEEDEPINSSAAIINSMEIDGVTYHDVLHFAFDDFRESWTDFTITDIYVAKQLGLIKYRYNNGVECVRK